MLTPTQQLIPMEMSVFSLQALRFILFFVYTSHVITAQTTNSNFTDFSCSRSSSSICHTYLIYRTQEGFLDLGNVSDLFGVSRLSLMIANDLPSKEVMLIPDQLLLVPILCSCTGNQSFANTTYQIKEGDSFYLVSISEFENLTNYVVVEALNPTLEPTDLQPGQQVIFPVLCKCPTKTQLDQGVNFLITYVWQDGDNIFELSGRTNSSAQALIAANNYRNFSAAVCSPILIPVSEPPHLAQSIYNFTSPPVDQKSRSGRTIAIVLGTAGALLTLIMVCFLLFAYCKCHQRMVFARTGSSLETSNLLCCKKSSDVEILSSKAVVDKLLPVVSQYLDKLVVYENKAIMEATLDLDERFRVGGSVYRATLSGQTLAVKKAKGDVSEELKILGTVSHANLVKLAGVSTDADGDFFLLYEYVENGSLDKWLYLEPSSTSSSSFTYLSWKQRVNVAVDVANGLQYMHEHTRPSIIHGSIRASNILLSINFKAKISNFSMAKPAKIVLTPATDVLAFGVVLLELLSGKRAVATREGVEMGMMQKEIQMILGVEERREERLRKWMDPNLESFYPVDGALNLAVLARACISETSSQRPSMAEVVFSLSLLAQSWSDAFERLTSNVEESLQITNPLAAR